MDEPLNSERNETLDSVPLNPQSPPHVVTPVGSADPVPADARPGQPTLDDGSQRPAATAEMQQQRQDDYIVGGVWYGGNVQTITHKLWLGKGERSRKPKVVDTLTPTDIGQGRCIWPKDLRNKFLGRRSNFQADIGDGVPHSVHVSEVGRKQVYIHVSFVLNTHKNYPAMMKHLTKSNQSSYNHLS